MLQMFSLAQFTDLKRFAGDLERTLCNFCLTSPTGGVGRCMLLCFVWKFNVL